MTFRRHKLYSCPVCGDHVFDERNTLNGAFNYISIRNVAKCSAKAGTQTCEVRYHINCFNDIAGYAHNPRINQWRWVTTRS